MILETFPAKFNPECPIGFVSVFDQKVPCFFYANEAYDPNNTQKQVMFCGIQYSKTDGKFSGFRVRSPNEQDVKVELGLFQQHGALRTTNLLLDDGTSYVVSPGYLKPFVKIGSSDKPFMDCWVHRVGDGKPLRLSGVDDFNDLDIEAIVKSHRNIKDKVSVT